MSVLEPAELEQSPLSDLHTIAAELGIEGYRRMRREELIGAIVSVQGGEAPAAAAAEAPPAAAAEAPAAAPDEPPAGDAADDESVVDAGSGPVHEAAIADDEAVEEGDVDDEAPARGRRGRPRREEEPEVTGSGVLDILPNGSGFMRVEPFSVSRDDVYVSPAQIRRCELRGGDQIAGPVRPARRSERHPSLVRVETVNGGPAEPPAERPRFEELTPVFATQRLPAPDGLDSVPYGRGSRVAVAGPPGAGASTLLRRIALVLAERHHEVELSVVLAGVRPEEVTEWRRGVSVPVVGGSFDTSTDEQARVAEMAVERAKRVAERGGDAAIVVDSLDALPTAVARRVFGAARNTEEAGTVTVFAATGLAPEPQRFATTRIVVEPGEDGPAVVAGASGAIRGDLLG